MKQGIIELSEIILSPVITEKSTAAADTFNRVVFKVRKDATKIQIKRAIELMFNVKVEAVQVLNVKGKQKRFGRSIGKRSDWKKAYVKLSPGHDINFSVA